MFTSRGYRQTKRENRNKSRQGQIIQQKPVFQIDNNPVVLDAYRKFILGSVPEKLLQPEFHQSHFDIDLSERDLSWTQQDNIEVIQTKLLNFAQDIFNQIQRLGNYPISLAIYSPNLNDSAVWSVMSNSSTLSQIFTYGYYNSIIIDREGNLSFSQYNLDYYFIANGTKYEKANNLTLGYNAASSYGNPVYGNPAAFKVSVYYQVVFKL